MRIRPTRLTPELVRQVTGIDGALLLYPKGVCHAIGVILDGLASKKATPSRGARYNSAVRYVYGRKQTIAVVISEDGMVDVLPKLMPRIRRADLTENLEKLRAIAAKPKVERGDLVPVEDWLRKHSFYLTPAQSKEANRLLKESKEKYGDDGPIVDYGELRPGEDLDDSYFIED